MFLHRQTGIKLMYPQPGLGQMKPQSAGKRNLGLEAEALVSSLGSVPLNLIFFIMKTEVETTPGCGKDL